MNEIVTLDIAGWRPALPPGAQEASVRAIEGGGVLVLPHVSFTLSERERRFLSPAWSDGRAKNISLDGGVAQGRGRKRRGSRRSGRDGRALRRKRGDAGGHAVPALCALCEARAHELSPATGRRAQRVVAQGRFAAARRRLSEPAQPWRADPARVLQHQPHRAARVARRRVVRDDGEDAAAAHSRPAAGFRRAAGGAARHQGPAQPLRSPDAEPARSREGGPRRTSAIVRSRWCASCPARPGCAFPTR